MEASILRSGRTGKKGGGKGEKGKKRRRGGTASYITISLPSHIFSSIFVSIRIVGSLEEREGRERGEGEEGKKDGLDLTPLFRALLGEAVCLRAFDLEHREAPQTGADF